MIGWTSFLFSFIVVLLLVFLRKRQQQMKIFNELGIAGPTPNVFLGNLLEIGKHGLHKSFQNWSKIFGSTFGYFEGPVPILVTDDLDLIKEVFVKQFDNFPGRKHLPLQPDPVTGKTVGMFVAEGSRWKRQRAILNPAFGVKRMKQLIPLITECTDALMEELTRRAKIGKSFDIHELYQSLTLDCIIGCLFGLKLESLRNPDEPILKKFRKFFLMFKNISPLLLLAIITPELNKDVWSNIYAFMMSVSQNSQKWLHNLASDIVKFREKCSESPGTTDFLQCMLDARAKWKQTKADALSTVAQKTGLTIEEVQSQCATLLAAGYETSSTALAYITYELALNGEIQQKLQKEIAEKLDDDEPVDYDAVRKLDYMDMVIKETLRMHPIAPIALNRRCQRDCKVAGYDIKSGMVVHANVYSIHYNADLWGPTDPSIFDPERFLPENIATRNPLAWMPFGVGPKNCIGMRFALMEIKLVLTNLLKKFTIVSTPETQVPLQVQEMATITPVNGIRVGLVERSP